MSDIDAFGTSAPHPAGDRLVHVAVHRQRRPVLVDRFHQSRPVHLQPTRHHVVPQQRDRGWHVRAQDVDRSERGDRGPIVLAGPDERLPHRRRPTEHAAGSPTGPAGDETQPTAGDLDDLAVQVRQPPAGHLVPQVGDVDVAQGQQGVRADRVHHVPVQRRHHVGEGAHRVGDAVPQVAIEAAQSLEVAGQPQLDERLDLPGAEDPAEDAVGRVVIVDVVDQVAEHDELFGPPGDLAEARDVAVHVGDERDPHRPNPK